MKNMKTNNRLNAIYKSNNIIEKNNYKKIICTNRKAFHDYFIFDKYEAGISLVGTEVKSCRANNVNLQDSFITINNNRVILHNAFIGKYNNGTYNNHEEKANRFLLLHKNEMIKLALKVRSKGYNIIPLSIYFNNKGKIKVEIALVKGKHNYDKRESLKDKQMKIDIKKNI